MGNDPWRRALLGGVLAVGAMISGGRGVQAAAPYQVRIAPPTIENRAQGLDLHEDELLMLLQRGLVSSEYVLASDSTPAAPDYDVQSTISWRERTTSGYRFDLQLTLLNHARGQIVRSSQVQELSLDGVGSRVSEFLTGLSGSIRVQCANYPQSEAFLDGRSLGRVPVTATNLLLGRYRVQVSYPDEAMPESLIVDVENPLTRELNFSLKEKPATLFVAVMGGPASVNLNGHPFDAPYSTLRPGWVHLTIRGIGRGWEYRKSLLLERHKDYVLHFDVPSRELSGSPVPKLGKPAPPKYGGWYMGLGYGYQTETSKDFSEAFGHFHTAQLNLGTYSTHVGLDFSGFIGLADGVEQTPEPFLSQSGRLRVAHAGGAAEVRLLAPWGQIGNRPIYPFIGTGGRYVRTGYWFAKQSFHYIDEYYDSARDKVSHMPNLTGYASAGLAIGKVELVGRYCVVGQDDPWWAAGVQWLFAGRGSRVIE